MRLHTRASLRHLLYRVCGVCRPEWVGGERVFVIKGMWGVRSSASVRYLLYLICGVCIPEGGRGREGICFMRYAGYAFLS